MDGASACNGLHDHISFDCADCGVDTRQIQEYYMVQDDLWKSVADKKSDLLCIGCLEKRLGRELVPDDFTDVPINVWPFFNRSDRLTARLGATQ